jgi:hypothetical protein
MELAGAEPTAAELTGTALAGTEIAGADGADDALDVVPPDAVLPDEQPARPSSATALTSAAAPPNLAWRTDGVRAGVTTGQTSW